VVGNASKMGFSVAKQLNKSFERLFSYGFHCFCSHLLRVYRTADSSLAGDAMFCIIGITFQIPSVTLPLEQWLGNSNFWSNRSFIVKPRSQRRCDLLAIRLALNCFTFDGKTNALIGHGRYLLATGRTGASKDQLPCFEQKMKGN